MWEERAKSLATAVSGEARPFKEKDNVLPEKGMIDLQLIGILHTYWI